MTGRQVPTGPREPVGAGAFALLNDQPVDEQGVDLLDFRQSAVRLVDLLVASRRQAPFTLGIYADWGMGKSSLMAQMRALLDERPGVRTLLFNAWTAERGGDALQELITSVLGRLDPNVLRRMLRRLRSGRALAVGRVALYAVLGPLGLGRVIDEIWRSMSVDARTRGAARDLVRQTLADWAQDDGRQSSPKDQG